MAGLLDFGSNPYTGLLSEEDLASARRQATTDALLKLSAGLFQAGAPSRTPQSLGAALVGGLQGIGSGYQNTLQQAAQQKLAQQKLQADLQAKRRTAEAQALITGAYRPAQAANVPMVDGERAAGPVRPEIPAGFDLQAIAPQLQRTAEGRAALSDILNTQKAMRGEAFNLGQGDLRFVTDAFGNTTQVAAGAPKLTESALDKKPLSADALAVMQRAFNTKKFEDLNPNQQEAILGYENAPTDGDVAKLRAEYARVGYETPGFNAPLPLSKSQVLSRILSSATAPTPSQAKPSEAPAVKKPFVRDSGGNIQITPEFAAKPMGEKEVPLIQSAAISAKDKKDLMLAKPKTTQAIETSLNSNRKLKRALIQLRNSPGMAAAFGFTGEFVSGISGTDAANAKAILEQIEGKAFVNSLTDMRAASITGAGVGNATEKEGDKLQRSYTTLKQSQSPEAALQEIDNLISVLDESEKIATNAYARTYGQPNFMLIDVEDIAPTVGLPSGVRVRKKGVAR